MRRPLMAGNWKMFKTIRETAAFLDEFLPLVSGAMHCDIMIAPPFTALAAAAQKAQGSNVAVGAQNLHWEKQGAFTGEVAAAMIADAGCRYVIIGHSERRQFFAETDEGVLKKTRAALGAGLAPIVCVGELAAEREAGQTEAVLSRQFAGGPGGLTPDEFARIIIAYEPVWAIGTGKVATPEIAADAHRFLRLQAAQAFGKDSAQALRILYGGSVKPDNVRGLMAQPEIDGTLVGGASLDAKSFAAIVNF
jgi:triosephosphate isomerase